MKHARPHLASLDQVRKEKYVHAKYVYTYMFLYKISQPNLNFVTRDVTNYSELSSIFGYFILVLGNFFQEKDHVINIFVH